ncbi:MAG: DUF3592 domain-containing protein [Alkalinema sp. RU_4_3]|nr:DUF3592 domain-containing protein [Alkalinema sp. RU_4_3]
MSDGFEGNSGMAVEKLVPLIFSGVSGLLLTIAAISGVITHQTLARERPAPGRVVDMVLRDSISQVDRRSKGSSFLSDRTYKETVAQAYYYPVVEFSLPEGQKKTVQLGGGSWPPAYEKGEAVTVLYDVEKPINARIKSTGGTVMMWFLPMLTGGMGVLFLAIAAAIYFSSRQKAG